MLLFARPGYILKPVCPDALWCALNPRLCLCLCLCLCCVSRLATSIISAPPTHTHRGGTQSRAFIFYSPGYLLSARIYASPTHGRDDTHNFFIHDLLPTHFTAPLISITHLLLPRLLLFPPPLASSLPQSSLRPLPIVLGCHWTPRELHRQLFNDADATLERTAYLT